MIKIRVTDLNPETIQSIAYTHKKHRLCPQCSNTTYTVTYVSEMDIHSIETEYWEIECTKCERKQYIIAYEE